MTIPSQTPWSVVYADGSANLYRVNQAAPDAEVVLEYVPVTRERSSTGMYSGGPPRHARLAPGDPRVAELWRRALALEADPALRSDARGKGTGAFTLTTPAGERSFIIIMGAALRELDAWLAQLGS